MRVGDGTYPKCMPLLKCHTTCWSLDQQIIFSGNIGEWALKGIVKDHAEKTQKQPDKFAEQCAMRKYESNVIKYVMTDISSQIGVSDHSSKTDNEMWQSRGRYTIHFCKTNNR